MKPPKPKPGRPITINADTQVMFRAPAELVRNVAKAAKSENVTASEWWRRAALEKLARAATSPAE